MMDANTQVVQSSSSLPLPPYTRLYAHVLGCIFDFLSFEDVHAAMQVNRDWCAVVNTMPVLTAGKRLDNPKKSHVASILASRLARHIVALVISNRRHPSRWMALAHELPYLREFSFCVDSEYPWDPTLPLMRLPAVLQHVDVTFSYTYNVGGIRGLTRCPSDSTINAMIIAVSHLPSMHTLSISIPSANAAISFAPLQRAQSLTSLRIDAGYSWAGSSMGQNHLLQIRQLQQLSHIDMKPCSQEAFLAFIQSGPPLLWRELTKCDVWIDDTLASLIPIAFPRVDSVSLKNCDLQRLHSFHFLPRITSLRKLLITCLGCNNHLQQHVAKMLDEMTEPLPLLQHLIFRTIPLDSTQLKRWLTLTPQLDEMELLGMSMTSSEFLSSVRTTLSHIAFFQCRNLDKDELVSQLQRLPHLTYLEFLGSPDTRLTAHSITMLTPPSKLLPALTSFKYNYNLSPTLNWMGSEEDSFDSDEEDDP
jgi:hypothetical protein